MHYAPVRTILAVIGVVIAFGIHAQDRSSGDRKLSSSDRSFIIQATNGGMVEVELSKIALRGSSRPDVQAFAKRLIDDHQKAGKALAAIAAKLGAPLHNPAVAEHADMKRFAQLAGERLDSAYVERMVRDHKGTIALFEKQADHGDAAELKEFATSTLPTLREHLEMVMALAEKKK